MRYAWMLAAATLVLAPGVRAEEPTPKFSIVAPKEEGIEAVDINGRGEVIGFEWVEDQPSILSQKPFLARAGAMTYLPLLAGYTATFPAALGDDGLVVGRASKPAPPGVFVPLRNQAFAWDARAGIRGLGALEGDTASFASGVARDGRRIAGYSIGKDRTRVCTWEREGDGWRVAALPQGPWLGAASVAISDDGRTIAAACGGPCHLWTEGAAGRWGREEIVPAGTLVPRAVNNGGTIAGIARDARGEIRAGVWTRGRGIETIDLPAGFVRSEAYDVNNAGVVVGMIDGPHGSAIGPRAFAFEGGKLHLLSQGDLPCVSAAAINDHRQVAGILEKGADDPPPPPGGNPGR